MSARKLFGRWRAVGPVALLIVLASLSLGARVNAQASPSTMGAWSQPSMFPNLLWKALQAWDSLHFAGDRQGHVLERAGGNPSLEPITGAFSEPAQPGWNIFCAELTHLTHGRIFVAGGHVVNSMGLPHAAI